MNKFKTYDFTHTFDICIKQSDSGSVSIYDDYLLADYLTDHHMYSDDYRKNIDYLAKLCLKSNHHITIKKYIPCD